MQCNVTEDITQLISCLELYLRAYENFNQMLSTHAIEQIKNCFKLGNVVEQTFTHFELTNGCDKWMEVLKKYFNENNKHSSYEIKFFSNACDQLLKRVFESKSTDIKVVDICVRIYTSLLPRRRFQAIISDILITSESNKAILDFVLANNNFHSRKLQYKLMLNKWYQELKMGKVDELTSRINELLKFSQVNNNLHILIGILAQQVQDEEEQKVQSLIMKVILIKMLDRSVLSKSFWLTLFELNKDDILKICEGSDEFLELLCNFLIYIGTMMDEEIINGKIQWTSSADISICPELNYNDVLAMLKLLSAENFNKRNFTLRKIKEAEHNTGSSLWLQIMEDL